MSDCAKCGKSVNVPDGYEFDEADLCWPCMAEDLKDMENMSRNLSDILDKVANALHGGRKENGLWSFHDLPELAEKAMKRIKELEE